MSLVNQPKQQRRQQAATNPSLALAVTNSRRRPDKPRKKQQQQKQPKKQIHRLEKVHNQISECSLMYASALIDPERTPEGACVPYGFPTPSMKQKVFTRGTFQLGTTGQGYILYNPVGANDAACITTTTSASVGTSATALNAFTGLSTANLAKLMFSTLDIVTNKTASWRYVAGGIKVRYAGTESGRNGTMCALEEPTHAPLTTKNGSDMRGYINSFVERPDPLGAFYGLNYSGPIAANETQFISTVNMGGTSFIAIFIDGIASDKYEYEVYHHVEYVGQNIPGVSASHADPVMYAKVVEATKATTVAQPLNDENAKSTFSRFLSSAGATIKGLIKQHGPDIMGMVSNALLPGSGFVTRSLLKAH
jgi:hypothetical protein